MLVVLALAALLLAAVPSMTGLLKTQRQSSAARQVVTDVRDARSKAITTGWQFRFVAYRHGASGSYKNQYRILGRRPGGTWPNIGDPNTDTANQFAGPWKSIEDDYPGVQLNPSDSNDSVTITFDARGVPSSAATLAVASADYDQTDLNVVISATGSVSSH